VPRGRYDPSQLELILDNVELNKALVLAPNPKPVNGKWVTQTAVRESLVHYIANQFERSTYSPARGFRLSVYNPLISTILANLLNAKNRDLQVIYSRDKAKKLGRQWISIWDFLASEGFINNIVAAKNMRGVKSWAVALPQLVRLFDLHKSRVTLSNNAVSVIVRDDEKQTLPVPKHRASLLEYNRHTKSVDKINDLWNAHTATLNSKPLIPFVQRVFKHSLQAGGRFYGEYQRIPSKDRANIKIDGCKTLEADYSSIHMAILYAWAGVQLDYDEAYSLDGFDRPTVKAVTLRALNINDLSVLQRAITLSANPINKRKYENYKTARNIHDQMRRNGLKSTAPFKPEWIKTFTESVPENTDAKELIAKILAKHHVINSYIGTRNLGLKLQAADSEIMSLILRTLTAKNIPALPIHDSIIFRAKDKDFAMLVMCDSFKKITRFEPNIKCLDNQVKRADCELNYSLF
jgi:hypothetical protein